jgi:large subunit ribosomal protein L20
MARALSRPASRKRRKRVLKQAKGFRGARSKLYRTANETVNRAMAYATRDRKQKKRAFRRLWITRLNAACRMCGISYSQCMNGLKEAKIEINRKILSEIAIKDFDSFKEIAALAKKKAA